MEFSENDVIQKAKTITKLFTSEILANQDPKGKCFTTCYPLSFLLEINDIDASIKMGLFSGSIHYWLKVDGTEIIIDPTIRQFKQNTPDTFIGIDKNREYEELENFNLNDAIFWWKSELIDPDPNHFPLPVNKQYNRFGMFRIILKSAQYVVLKVEEKRNEDNHFVSQRLADYFSHIQEMINAKKNADILEALKLEIPAVNSIITNPL